MDSSWFHAYATANTAAAGNNGFMCGYAASCTSAELEHEEEDEQLINSQIQHHLNQINMHMNILDDDEVVYDDGALDMHQHMVDGLLDPHHHASSFPSSSSSSSLSLRSASLSSSPTESSAQVFGGAPAAGGQYPEVSSHIVPLPPAVPYGANVHIMAARESPATGGAFKRFARHLGPRRQQPKPGSCGQRMFKTALSVLSKMHAAASARYNQQQYYNQQAAFSAEAAAPPSVNQLQHMISERKRREKLNDSFHALKIVLPPGAKKDKTSILIRAREYIRALESKASELEEKNRSLELQLLAQRGSSDGAPRKHCGGGNEQEPAAGEKNEVQAEITRAAAAKKEMEPRNDLCTLRIAVRSLRRRDNNITDVVLRTLQCLKEQAGEEGDVSLVSMDTAIGGGGPPHHENNSSPRAAAVLTMQIKSSSSLMGAKWAEEQQPVKDAALAKKVVADALI